MTMHRQQADLVLFTYALLPRDAARLGQAAVPPALILVGAPGPSDATAQGCAIRRPQASGAIRLSYSRRAAGGHLSELWVAVPFPGTRLAQAPPGFAPDLPPIERGDEDAISRTAAPPHCSCSRRTKRQVASGLPPKADSPSSSDSAGLAQNSTGPCAWRWIQVRGEIARRGLRQPHQ